MKRRAATASAASQTDGAAHADDEHDKAKGRSRRAGRHPLVTVGAAAATACLVLTAAASYGGAFPKGGGYLRSLSTSVVTGGSGEEDFIFIAIKTTHTNQKRISSILDSYWNFAPRSIAFFTDSPADAKADGETTLSPWHTISMKDSLLADPTRDEINLIDTGCGTDHNINGLCCKTAAEIVYYHDHSDADWLCHLDDDTFLNYPALVEYLSEYDASKEHFIGYGLATWSVQKDARKKLEEAKKKAAGGKVPPRLSIKGIEKEGTVQVSYATGGAGWCLSRPLVIRGIDKLADLKQTCWDIVYSDDVTLGYVIQVQLGVEMKKERRLHSHLDSQAFASKKEAMQQLTFGSGYRTKVDPVRIQVNQRSKDANAEIAKALSELKPKNTKNVFSFVSYPGASFVDEKTKLPPENDPLGFHALYCDLYPEKCT